MLKFLSSYYGLIIRTAIATKRNHEGKVVKMSKEKRKANANRSGVVLVTAVGVIVMITILLSAVIHYVSVNKAQTNDNYKKEQAYLTASSTVQSFVAQIEQDTAAPESQDNTAALLKQKKAIESLQALAKANSGKGTTTEVKYNGEDGKADALGTTTITIKTNNGSETDLVLLAKTTYAGHTEQVAAHISTATKRKPADLNNCIELTGDHDQNYDNLNVVGDMACLNDSTSISYKFANNVNVYGSYKMAGSLYPGQENSKVVLKSALWDSTQGSSMIVTEGIYYWLDCTSSKLKTNDNSFNYICTDGCINFSDTKGKKSIIGSAGGFDVDAFCSYLYVGKEGLEQYGNMCVYAGSGTNKDGTARNGDAYFDNEGSVNIHGNLYVDGDLYIVKRQNSTTITVDGSVYVGGSVKILTADKSAEAMGWDPAKGQSVPYTPQQVILGTTDLNIGEAPPKSGRTEKPGSSKEDGTIAARNFSNDYIYSPEDFFLTDDTSLSPIASTYKSFYNGGNTLTFADFRMEEDTASDGSKGKYIGDAFFRFVVTDSCTLDPKTIRTSGGNDSTGKAYTSDLGGHFRTCIIVKDKDIVIRLGRGSEWVWDAAQGKNIEKEKNGFSWDSQYDPLIVVKNESEMVTDSETGSVDHKYNCYFVSDSGTSFTINSTPDTNTGKYLHSYPSDFVKPYYHIDSITVLDYDTFVNAFDTNIVKGSTWNHGMTPKSDFVMNVSEVDDVTADTGVKAFKPDHASIFFFMGEGTTFEAGNNSIFQGCWYSPDATVNIATGGMSGWNFCDSAGSTKSTTSLGVCNIGVVNADSFGSKNLAYYVFNKPSATSLMAAAKGAKDKTLNGFKLDRFDHY